MTFLKCPRCKRIKNSVEGYPPMCQECYDALLKKNSINLKEKLNVNGTVKSK